MSRLIPILSYRLGNYRLAAGIIALIDLNVSYDRSVAPRSNPQIDGPDSLITKARNDFSRAGVSLNLNL